MKARKLGIFTAMLLFVGMSFINAQEVASTTDATTTDATEFTQAHLEKLLKDEEKAKKFMEELKTPGVKVDGDTMHFSAEAQRLLKDESYRNQVYKDEYTFVDVKMALAGGEYQKAFWQMLNLYPENKENVVKFIYAYDNAFPTDEVVVAAFYTYGFFDPKITKLEGDRPDVYRPDIFEEYLRRTREIVSYILYFREQKAAGKS